MDGFNFLAMTSMSDSPFYKAKFDGVLGLARSKIGSTDYDPNFVLALFQAKVISKPSFSLYYSQGFNDLSRSQLILAGGSENSNLFHSGSLKEFPVPEDGESTLGFWRLRIDDIALGAKSLGLCDQKKCFAYFDSGS